MGVDTGQESMCEIEVWLEEKHCHCLETEIDEHAVGHQLGVVLISRLFEIDDRSKHVDSFLEL